MDKLANFGSRAKEVVGSFATEIVSKLMGPEKFHIKARSALYPASETKRFPVPDNKVSWSVDFPEYKPVDYTAPSVLKGPVWADPDCRLTSTAPFKFNDVDGKVNRKSYVGKYEVVDGLPQNPHGRTGVTGRGLLGKWGPNHAADPIVTRWKRDDKGHAVKHVMSGKPVLQFVAVQRKDTNEWALPGGMVDAYEKVSFTLKREFGEEALNTLEATAEKKKQIEGHINKLFHGNSPPIYQGYVDDPRNTDNAWMETFAVNFHDETGDSVGMLPLSAGDDAGDVTWMEMDSQKELYASHSSMLHQVASKHNAHW